MTRERGITRSASVVSAATVLSRVLGFVRDAAVAYVFGAGMHSDAFFVAFRISNLLRRLVGEGAMTSSFIPIFTEEMTLKGKESAKALSSSVFTLFFFILAALTVLGVLFSGELVRLMTPGFTADAEKFSLTVSLTRLMFPYMVFIGLMAIAMGVLNSFKHFALPALAPVALNIAMIFSIFALTPVLKTPVHALAYGVLFGGFLQFAMQLPVLKSHGMLPLPSFSFNNPAIKKIFLLMGPAAFGVGVYQLNILVTTWFASRLPEGAVSYLYYSGRVMELPIGVFSVSVATAVLPSLSLHAVREEWPEFRDSLSFAVRIVNFVTIPATMGLLVMSYPITDILFRRGEFGDAAAAGTSVALIYYAVGLVPVSASRLLSSVFYSLKDTVTPVWSGAIAFVFNIIFCLALVGPLSHGGLALATSLSAVVNTAVLFLMLRMRHGRFGGRKILSSALKTTLSSAITGAIIYSIVLYSGYSGLSFPMRAAFVVVTIFLAIAIFLALASLFKVSELSFLKDFFRKAR